MKRVSSVSGLELLLLAGVLTQQMACSVQLVSEYDEETDRAKTQIQRKLEAFFLELEQSVESQEGQYANHRRSYDEMRVDIGVLRTRAAARAKNDLQVQQVELLLENLRNLEELYKLGLTREQIPPIRNVFNSAIPAILKLELAKKRGEK